MSKITKYFEVQGSASWPYRVTFELDGENLNAYCTCPAGENGLYCKHRLSILKGDSRKVVSDNREIVEEIRDQWLPGTDVEKALLEVAIAEDALATAKNQLREAKHSLAVSLRR